MTVHISGRTGFNGLARMTPEGGFAVLLVNKTGAGLAKTILHFN